MRKYAIYRIYNTKTMKCYIGLTSNRARRKKEHFNELRRECHSNPYLQASYNKHGRKAFRFEIIETGLSRELAIEKEIAWIDFYDSFHNGYNCTRGGDTQSELTAIACEWNGKNYTSISQMALENNIPPSCAFRYIRKGYTCDDDVPLKEVQVMWNGVLYPSYAEAARELGVTDSCIKQRIELGYESDDDIYIGKSVTWNGIEYKSIAEAARGNDIAPNTMSTRLSKGYTCDDDMPKTNESKSCIWNGVKYKSLASAAKALGLHPTTMTNRIQQGYTCDDDMQQSA